MKKDFNTYKEGLDLEVLRQYCMEHGEVRTFLRGETLEEGGTARLTSVSWRVPGRAGADGAFGDAEGAGYLAIKS